ncbi:MAG: hypothetical protein AB9903_13955 [Vulcanimicrobiota bacterium]
MIKKRIAIFVEGKTEFFFVFRIIRLIFDIKDISYHGFELIGKLLKPMNYECRNDQSQYFFQVVIVGNDERVISAIKENEASMIERGFDLIIGLRDMYSKDYDKKARGSINPVVTRKFLDSTKSDIEHMNNPSKISFHYAVMELEAWFLSMYKILERIHRDLTVDRIKDMLGIDLSSLDPEQEFYKPSKTFRQILGMKNVTYNKSEHVIKKIVNKIEPEDLDNLLNSNKCKCCVDFYREIDAIRI